MSRRTLKFPRCGIESVIGGTALTQLHGDCASLLAGSLAVTIDAALHRINTQTI
jgi:hypothetical protein